MDAAALNPRALFDGNVCYEIPPFQRPYVWNEEDQWQPLWDDVARVADTLLCSPGAAEQDESVNHFLGAVVLKLRDSPAGEVARRSVIDGQQRLTTLQLMLDAAQLVLDEHGDEDDAESIQELVFNAARRFRNTPSRFKLWPSRADRHAFECVMDNDLDLTPAASASRIWQAHSFFPSAIRDWADVTGDPDKAKRRLAILSQVLQQRLQIVAINLSASDDDQLIFETLNDRGTPLTSSRTTCSSSARKSARTSTAGPIHTGRTSTRTGGATRSRRDACTDQGSTCSCSTGSRCGHVTRSRARLFSLASSRMPTPTSSPLPMQRSS